MVKDKLAYIIAVVSEFAAAFKLNHHWASHLFRHEPTHEARAETKLVWAMPCEKEENEVNKADVQWSFRGISTPMGVATYNNVRIKDMLPTQEQLRERMELLQRELRETKRLMGKS